MRLPPGTGFSIGTLSVTSRIQASRPALKGEIQELTPLAFFLILLFKDFFYG